MRILLTTDGSLRNTNTLRFAVQFAARAGRPPTLLTVCRPGAQGDRAPAEAILASALAVLQPELPTANPLVRVGSPADEILAEIEEGAYDLAVVGVSQRLGLVRRYLLGSTALKIVEHALCPVLIVKGRIGPVRKVLLCDSGAESPILLSALTRRLTGFLAGDEEVTILHAMSQISAGPGIPGKALRAQVDELIQAHTPEGELLEHDVEALEQAGVHPHPKVRHGMVVDEILAEAQEGDYDLVVIGAYRGKGWQRVLLDDLASKIVEGLDRPVLVIR